MRPNTQKTQLEQAKKWYTRLDVCYEIIKHTQNKELAVLTPQHLRQEANIFHRNLRCHNVQNLQHCLTKYLNTGTPINIYNSLATYEKGVPVPIDNNWWKTNHWKQIVAFDMLLDIDSPTQTHTNLAKETCLQIHKHLNSLQVPHQIRFTGNGFHIILPSQLFVGLGKSYDPYSQNSIYTDRKSVV
jgi:hypothetical protein